MLFERTCERIATHPESSAILSSRFLCVEKKNASTFFVCVCAARMRDRVQANEQRKCLIPLIDMVNHHPSKGAAQVLSGRAAPGSFMKVS